MTEVICLFVSIVLLCSAMVTRPSHAGAPPGWWVNGIRPDGAYELRRVPVGDDAIGLHGEEDHTLQPPGVVYGRIYCTGGMRAIVVNERAVGCQR